jgi:uncharacterized protein (DUF427 family)
MSLTLGSIAPLGRPTGGTLNVPIPAEPGHILYLHELPARIRGLVGPTAVVDSTHARMLHESRLLPRWYFPREEIATDLLEPSTTSTHCPFKGDARYWHLRVGDRLIEDAFWEYPEPLPGAPDLSGLLSPYTEKLDRWLEEDEDVLGHPRDPFHRVDSRASSARVVVRLDDTVVADTTRAVACLETGLPVRWYVPLDDVAPGVLEPTATHTTCPYKGVASYWTVVAGGRRAEDAAWAYPDPLAEAEPLRGHVAFLGEGVAVDVTR